MGCSVRDADQLFAESVDGALRARARSRSAANPHRVMLAVLPFVNLSNDPEQEYFSEGLTEETITDLGELNPEQLGLIARTSSTAYKGTNKTIAQIGKSDTRLHIGLPERGLEQAYGSAASQLLSGRLSLLALGQLCFLSY
jgi:hypothetical protein